MRDGGHIEAVGTAVWATVISATTVTTARPPLQAFRVDAQLRIQASVGQAPGLSRACPTSAYFIPSCRWGHA